MEKKNPFIYQSTGDDMLGQFSFRLLHRIILTTKNAQISINWWGNLHLLPYFDSVEYTFLDCYETKSFYFEALVWSNRVNEMDIELSNEQIAFNEIPDFHHLSEYPSHRLHFVILMKPYVYSWIVLKKKPIQKEFQTKILMKWALQTHTL